MPRVCSRLARFVFIAVSLIPFAAHAQSKRVVQFVGVTAGDKTLEHNDKELCSYLSANAGITCHREERQPTTYQAGIDLVTEYSKSGQPFVARLTPYALVAAELQGARFQVLATYSRLSAQTGKEERTYHSYFVVRAKEFRGEVDIPAITTYLTNGPGEGRRFAFHDRFSTSSFFVPLLFFKQNEILRTKTGRKYGDIHPIRIVDPELGDDALSSVKKVENELADIAAVWDGTLKKIDDQQNRGNEHIDKSKLQFVRMDRVLPNDLIVASKAIPQYERVLDAIRRLPEACRQRPGMFKGDVVCWWDLRGRDSETAALALRDLRRDALPEPPRMTVQIKASGDDSALQRYVAAAEHAIRFAGTEFVVYDDIRDEAPDIDWQLELLHEGAIRIISTVHGIKEVQPQELNISFTNENDLPQRIESRVHSELNRIRYIWPYRDTPTVLRDVNFSIPPDTAIIVQPIVWKSLKNRTFDSDTAFGSFRIKPPLIQGPPDMSTFTLHSTSSNERLALDPMSNVAYRVVLVPPRPVRPMFTYLTVAAVILFVAALIAALFEVIYTIRARARSQAGVGASRPAPAAALPE